MISVTDFSSKKVVSKSGISDRSFLINSREAVAAAFIGLLLVFLNFAVKIFDVQMTHNHFKSAACMTSFFTQCFLVIRMINFLVTRESPHSQEWLFHFEIDFGSL